MTDVVYTSRPQRSTSFSGDISVHSVMERRASQDTDEGADSAGFAGSRASRKRAAFIDIEEANSPRVRNFSLETEPMSSEGSKDSICLCTPALKVPRPRNAFILYRQHHQAQVIADHPGLSNPEISKIIGEQWRKQDPEVKDSWKQLAEEEKLRHQRQYPDYRYRPRRGGRPGSRPGSSPSADSGQCTKCGGRYIATLRTPSTPLGTPTAAKSNMQPNPPSDIRSGDSDHLRRMLPGGNQPYQYQHSNVQEVEEEYEPMSPSPELKRRRFNAAGHYQAVSSPGPYTGHPLSRQPRSSLSTPPTPPVASYGPLPGPSSLARTGHGNMAPPPRPHHPAYAGPSRGPGYDESLRLPPLQTQSSPPLYRDSDGNDRPSAHPVTGLGIANLRDSNAKSLEAKIMKIPFWSKLMVLQKISPTLAPPGPDSPDVEIRGAVVAVEGADPRQLEQVGTAVHRSLLGLGEIDLKTWSDGPSTPVSILSAEEDVKMNDTASVGSSRKSSHSQLNLQASDLFSDYMETMLKWRVKSREIIKHVSTRPVFGPDAPPLTRRASEGEAVGSRHNSISAPCISKTPIALLPAGFSLTMSDKYACTTPIRDSYAPVDHWQWMSTLWRGIIGPDLVIYVNSVAEEEVTRGGAVEFQGPGVMVVRIAHQKSLDEKTGRRISFEVVEWIRGGSYQEGFGRG
ncbi:HMG box protein [Colletotrichum orchidophilum]|uniref:HMG box protein n=1 Tax=Colletotrichum orchidophilum TaxID=1209926 RepID=A0A1G4BFU9_9PEZI|nr:HMG box protein [Colletotrichum orchidophilum]OHF00312.1 HMG box protein [Colletotrichum orchidophilum]